MSDHMVDHRIITNLIKYYQDQNSDENSVLCVDYNLQNPLVDLDDVTKVQTEGDSIKEIGKQISEYNCFDTGIFLCSPYIFKALEESSKLHNDTSLSGAINVSSTRNSAKTFDISGSFWIDVDDMPAFSKAETFIQQMESEE